GPESEIGDGAIKRPTQTGLRDIDSIRRKLLAVRAQVRSRKTELSAELFAADDRAENRVLAAEHLGCFHEVALFDRFPDRRAANHFTIHLHGLNADDVELVDAAQLFQQ